MPNDISKLRASSNFKETDMKVGIRPIFPAFEKLIETICKDPDDS